MTISLTGSNPLDLKSAESTLLVKDNAEKNALTRAAEELADYFDGPVKINASGYAHDTESSGSDTLTVTVSRDLS